MDGLGFRRVIDEAFNPFLEKLGFVIEEPLVSGRFYRVNFNGSSKAVSVYYEPGDCALFVYIFSKEKDGLSDIDDRNQTPRLTDLNCRYMSMISAAERVENEHFFRNVSVKDEEERLLLKCAKELRLVLPKHLRSRSMG